MPAPVGWAPAREARPSSSLPWEGGQFLCTSLLLPLRLLPYQLLSSRARLRATLWLISAHTHRPHRFQEPRGGLGATCSHVSPQPAHSGPALRSATRQLSTRPGEPAALDAGPDRHGRVPGPRCNCLCCQPLLVPRRAGAREHGRDRWQQGRWDSGRNGREVFLDGGQLQVQ